ncbi:MAG: alpha amylase C-terminal domain-containing protein, partial [Deltaproteobacteria bacterium]|nr:alpha amylase C-terminal domain-containing protein [Deltaproteobacteria bacterium]
WREVLNTDSELYGGSNVGNFGGREAVNRERRHSLTLTLPPLGALAFMPARG